MSRVVLLRLASCLLGPFPYRLARGLGRLGGSLAWWRGAGRELVPRHLVRLGVDPGRAREVLASYGEYWTETLWLAPRRLAGIRSRLTIEGLEHYEQAHADGRGAIYALPHVGNWEYAAILPWSLGKRVIAVAEALPDRAITDWFTKARAMVGIEIVLADGSRGTMQALLRGLAEGAGVALLSDRDVTGSGIEVEFFGETTRLPSGPVALALSTGMAVLPVACFSTRTGHHLVFRPPLEIPAADHRQERVRLGVQAMAAELEELIGRDPIQWHLLQPNWPSDPGYRR